MSTDQLDDEIQKGLQAMQELQEHQSLHGDEPQEEALETRRVIEGKVRYAVYRILLVSESEEDPLTKLDDIAANASTPSHALALKSQVQEAQDARFSEEIGRAHV